MSNNKQSIKLYTEEQVKEAIDLARVILNDGSPYPKYIILSEIKGIELPSIEEIEEAALKQFPYPIDIKDKNDEIIKTRGVKPFNHSKIEKYRTAFTIGAKYVCSKIQGGK